MRKHILGLVLLLIASSLLQAYIWGQADTRLFQEAKILIFDKKWEEAQEKLDEILKDYPDSRWHSQALFYKGKCLKEQRGKQVKALEVYKQYIRLKDANEDLKEESEAAIIELALELYERGRRSYLSEIDSRLDNPSRSIRYYAALQLSLVKDKRIAEKALPVLKEILIRERDEEFRDRARLAILRIDPDAFEEFEEDQPRTGAKILYFRVYKTGQKKPTFSLNIPWALADLAFSAIPKEAKVSMREEGYDLDRIIRQLLEYEGEVFTFEDEEEGTIVKMWIK